MPKLAAKTLRALAAHLVQQAEVLQRMAREAKAEAQRWTATMVGDGGRVLVRTPVGNDVPS
jgi:hypothetical protein